jgi:hypothetical protein
MAEKKEKENQYVSIVAVTLGIFMIIAVLFLILAKEELGLLVPISWAFVVLGIAVAALSTRRVKK